VRWFELWTLGTMWDSNAYGSIVWVTMGIHTSEIVADVGETAVLTALMFTAHTEPKRLVDVDENSRFWDFVIVSWIPAYLLIYWGRDGCKARRRTVILGRRRTREAVARIHCGTARVADRSRGELCDRRLGRSHDRRDVLFLIPAGCLGVIGVAAWLCWSAWSALRREAEFEGG
jgi:hypothetical protein